MLSTLLMKGYETFEGAYAQVLSGLARNRLALAVAGRVSQHRNLLERWITIQKDQADVVAELGRSRLLAYRPVVSGRDPRPVLMVPSLVNRHYILDLVPGRSVAEHLLNAGHPTYMMDWGRPGPEDKGTTLDELLFDRLDAAVSKIQSTHGASPTMMGYCMGGTMALVYAAQRPGAAAGLVLLATPVDFDKVGLLTLWARHEGLNLDDLVDTWGLVPPAVLQPAFTLLKPSVLTRKWVTFVQFAGDPEKLQAYLPMFRWATDNVSIPGEVLRTWTRDYFQRNGLVRGGMIADGSPVDLSRLKTPILNVVALQDHIIEPDSPRALKRLLPSRADYTLLECPMGHTDLSIGPQAGTLVLPEILRWLKSHKHRATKEFT